MDYRTKPKLERVELQPRGHIELFYATLDAFREWGEVRVPTTDAERDRLHAVLATFESLRRESAELDRITSEADEAKQAKMAG